MLHATGAIGVTLAIYACFAVLSMYRGDPPPSVRPGVTLVPGRCLYSANGYANRHLLVEVAMVCTRQ